MMKKKMAAMLLSAALLCTGTVGTAWADSTDNAGTGEKAVVAQDTNPNTGAVTLATVSVALAGCVVLVFKKRK